MKLEDFILKWQGKFIDFDGYYGNQCFDLLHQYCVECLGITDGRVLAAPGAKDIFEKFDTIFGRELFDKIANTPDGIPNEGDIIVWNNGKWGHVAIFYNGNVNTFKSFDQNYPTSSCCHIQGHNYNNVLGWLRYKGNFSNSDSFLGKSKEYWLQVEKDREDLMNQVRELTKSDKGYQELLVKQAQMLNCEPNSEKINGKIEGLLSVEDQKNNTLKELAKTQETLKSTADQLEEKEKELTNIEEMYKGSQAELNKAQTLANQVPALQKRIEELEKVQPINKVSNKQLINELLRRIFKK